MTQEIKIRGKVLEIFFAEDGHIELYEVENPGKTGFIFDDLKELYSFVNNLTDVIEQIEKEQ